MGRFEGLRTFGQDWGNLIMIVLTALILLAMVLPGVEISWTTGVPIVTLLLGVVLGYFIHALLNPATSKPRELVEGNFLHKGFNWPYRYEIHKDGRRPVEVGQPKCQTHKVEVDVDKEPFCEGEAGTVLECPLEGCRVHYAEIEGYYFNALQDLVRRLIEGKIEQGFKQPEEVAIKESERGPLMQEMPEEMKKKHVAEKTHKKKAHKRMKVERLPIKGK